MPEQDWFDKNKPAALDWFEANAPKESTAASGPPRTEPDMRSWLEVARDQALNVAKGVPQAITGLPASATAALQTVRQGLSGNAGGVIDSVLGMVQPLTTVGQGINALISPNTMPAPTQPEWEGAAQGAGALAAGAAIDPAIRAVNAVLPNAARAGANLDRIRAAAKSEPNDIAAAAKEAARSKELNQTTGATLPPVIRAFIRNHVDSGSPLMYPEGFDIASQAGQYMANATKAMKAKLGMQWAQIGKFTDAIKTANRDTAERVGMGDLYDQAMKEYRQAKTIEHAKEVLGKWTTRAIIAAGLGAAGTAGYDLYQNLKR